MEKMRKMAPYVLGFMGLAMLLPALVHVAQSFGF